MDRNERLAVIESVLFLSDGPVTLDQLSGLFGPEVGRPEIQELMEELVRLYDARGLQIQEVGGGYRMGTREEYAEWVQKFHRMEKSSKLSRASLESLAIIAYKQPLTRAEVEDIRGVDSLGVLKTLMNHNLIKIMGRKKVPGRPVIYGTTKRFLEYFGLASLSELPTIQEFEKTPEHAQQELLLQGLLERQDKVYLKIAASGVSTMEPGEPEYDPEGEFQADEEPSPEISFSGGTDDPITEDDPDGMD